MLWQIKCERAGEFVAHEIREFATSAEVHAHCMAEAGFHGLAFAAEPIHDNVALAWSARLQGLWNKHHVWRGVAYGLLANIPLLLLERLI